jgi:alkylation response protein AidB-like acyl-CoA dehydrogenase
MGIIVNQQFTGMRRDYKLERFSRRLFTDPDHLPDSFALKKTIKPKAEAWKLSDALQSSIIERSKRHLVPNTIGIHNKKTDILDLRNEFLDVASLGLPEKYGGLTPPLGAIDMARAHENIAYGSASMSAYFVGIDLFKIAILLHGTDTQKESMLRPIADGNLVGCFGYTGQEGGARPKKLRSKPSLAYTIRQGKYVLNGSKTHITNGPISDYTIAFAWNGRACTAFIVPSIEVGNGNGFTVPKESDKATKKLIRSSGWRGSKTSDLFFDGVEVSAENILGAQGSGEKIAVETLLRMRLNIASQAVGIMYRAYDEALAFAIANGLTEISNVREKFWQMANKIGSVEFNVAMAAAKINSVDEEHGSRIDFLSRFKPVFISDMAKLKLLASNTVRDITDQALKIAGASGLNEDYPFFVLDADSAIYGTVAGANDAIFAQAEKLRGWKRVFLEKLTLFDWLVEDVKGILDDIRQANRMRFPHILK